MRVPSLNGTRGNASSLGQEGDRRVYAACKLMDSGVQWRGNEMWDRAWGHGMGYQKRVFSQGRSWLFRAGFGEGLLGGGEVKGRGCPSVGLGRDSLSFFLWNLAKFENTHFSQHIVWGY